MTSFWQRFAALLAAALTAAVVMAAAAAGEDWPTYLHDSGRSSTSSETTLSTSNAGQLAPLWRFQTGGGVASSPTVAGGVVYVGSWDGYEYALDAATGALKWKTFLGITTGGSTCPYPSTVGVTSSATVLNGVVYLGGGDSNWYALDASTGAVLWKVFTGDNSATGGHYNWSSPLIYNGSAYIGVSSLGDCPLVQGELLRVDLSTKQVVSTFKSVPDGQVGGGIWSTPTVDATTNTIYVTTGNAPSNDSSHPYVEAVVALDATTLAVKGSWQVPASAQVAGGDGDWGTSPTLIGGGLFVATNKNGVVYAFQRSNVPAGPVWQQRIANSGASPESGDGSVSSAAFDGSRVYVAGSMTTIGTANFNGSVSALDPGTGTLLWRQGEPGFVIPALASVNGLVIAGIGSNLTVINASNGQTLFSYATGGPIFSPPTISSGRIFEGSQDGYVYSFGLPSSQPLNTERVNAGGGAYVDSAGNNWSADCCNSGGQTYTNAVAIAGTSDSALYQSQRWNSGPFSYTFTGLAAGNYQVTLKFAEIAYLAPGQRQFNVAIQGTQVLTNFDVAAQVGFNTALDKTFTATVGTNGQLVVSFIQGAANNPIINAIQVVPATSSTGTLSFATGAQTITAGQPSAAMQVATAAPPSSSILVGLSSSSSTGQFSTNSAGPWSSTLTVTIPSGGTQSGSFYYHDTKAGSSTLTASAANYISATQVETVNAAALASISLSPSSANLIVGSSQLFSASGADQYGNPVSVSSAAWTTTAPGTLSPTSGSSTTFTASSAGSGQVAAAMGNVSGSATVTVSSIPAPTNLTATGKGKGRIALSWQGSGSGVTYNIYRGTAAGQESTNPIASSLTSTAFTDTSLSSGTIYYYYVVAVASTGSQSAPSNEASATAK